ncbi:P-loop containing nucleoside triphosphate hydrolase protein, partial [Catenaria anguillulae PL171]
FVTSGGLATLVAYGQTGAGKTFTMTSLNAQLPQDIFPHISSSHHVTLAYFEIYGDEVCDLLNEREKVHIRATNEATVVTGVAQRVVSSPQEFLHAVETGAEHRRTRATFKNDVSSRSHAVCAVSFYPKNTVAGGAFTPPEHLTLAGNTLLIVDLAGSERASDQAHHDAIRIRETQITNKSLMTLKECIRNRYLSSLPSHANKHIHIPFRTSKLTLVLREALDPAARVPTRTILIGHLAPSLADSQHSLSTARYVANLKASSMDHAKQATARLGGPANSASNAPVHPSKWTYKQLARKFAQWSNNAIVLDKIVPFVAVDNTLNAFLERRKAGEKAHIPPWMELQQMPLWEWVAKCKAIGVTEATATKAFEKYQIELATGRTQTKAKGEQLSVLLV